MPQSFDLNQYLALPPVGFASAAVVLLQLNSILTSGSRQAKNPWGYSKFSKAFVNEKKRYVPGWLGSCIAYAIPLAANIAHLIYNLKFKRQDYVSKFENKRLNLSEIQYILPNLMMIFHFSKRIFESLFIHIYTNETEISGAMTVGTFYSFLSFSSLYYHSMINENLFFENSKLSLYIGSFTFIIGQCGNFIHHYLLRRNRLSSMKNNEDNDESNKDNKKARVGSKNYVIPNGGLFSLLWTPHYFFELVGWYGVAIVSKHLNFYLMAGCYTSYLVGRAIATKEWYQKEFAQKCPKRYAIVPFVV